MARILRVILLFREFLLSHAEAQRRKDMWGVLLFVVDVVTEMAIAYYNIFYHW
ncbi:hypothetical protein H6G27_08090 [Nostoc linckia FACHB-104]|nr:hypothetical protein [Nostoc linckia FACHB-104]